MRESRRLFPYYRLIKTQLAHEQLLPLYGYEYTNVIAPFISLGIYDAWFMA